MNFPRILVDNCALADLFFGESRFEVAASELRRKFPIWIAPPLIRYEFGNVIRTQIRTGRLSAETGESMMLKGMEMVSFCLEPSESMILQEANISNLTFYDATYVATAKETGLMLYTRDGDVLKNCPEVAREISSI